MISRRNGVALAAIWLAGPAKAHAFLPEGGFYDRFIEGTLVVFAYPATLLPLMALGLLASLWEREGFPRAWPALILGQLVGVGLAAATGPWIVTVLMGAGALVAILAALSPSLSAGEVRLAAGATGALAVAASLEGHGLFELSLAIHLGILFAANLVVAVAAGLPRVVLEWRDDAWLRILWRVAASWIAAVLILFLAFTLSR
ncbi:hypothetical protein GCM10016455_28560 [Aliiroseovarius zhejiangensis]|uniref:Uncharacterized protein n=1 Tax=Aliiroseovarius zhejiangensis TaxID=1632025 RepID=A0ABQ3JAW7_9RHOB|nr:hypothetical protein [Aliiroseovarius zhejiangensis]GHF05569.1 hypothetical protein GCM10016455_28560 [Aliiroseovarius zhejiangensis]